MDEQPLTNTETNNLQNKARSKRLFWSLIACLLLTFGGYARWYLLKTQDLNAAIHLSSIPQAHRPVLLPRIDPGVVTGWKTYHSTTGKFSFRYPAFGWRLEAPRPHSFYGWLNASELKGDEQRLFLSENIGQGRSNADSQFRINISIADSASGANSYIGYISPEWGSSLGTLPNGIRVWETSYRTYVGRNSLKCGFTNVGIVLMSTRTGNKSYTALPSGKFMNYIASFCPNGIPGARNKLSLNYGLQARGVEMQVAQEVLGSIKFE